MDIIPSQTPTSRAVMWSLVSLRCLISSTSHFILIKHHIITIWPSPSPLLVGLCSSILSFLLQIWDPPKATALVGTLGVGLFSPCIWQARYLLYNLAWKKFKAGCSYTLRKVNMNTMIVYQYTLHFEICLLAVLLMLKLDERILKTVVGALVPYDLARYDLAKTAEN